MPSEFFFVSLNTTQVFKTQRWKGLSHFLRFDVSLCRTFLSHGNWDDALSYRDIEIELVCKMQPGTSRVLDKICIVSFALSFSLSLFIFLFFLSFVVLLLSSAQFIYLNLGPSISRFHDVILIVVQPALAISCSPDHRLVTHLTTTTFSGIKTLCP